MSLTLSGDAGFTHLPLVADATWVTWELVGPAEAPLVVVLGGISAGRHATSTPADPRPGWWEALVGPGRAVDTTRFRVLSLDWVTPGGTEDQARALTDVLDQLGVARAHRVIGASFGGMVGLAFAALFPDRIDGLVAMSAPHRPHPAAVAWRSLQREVVRLGLAHGDGARALAIARGMAITSYRTPEELAERFPGGATVDDDAPVHRWLSRHGARYAATESPERWLALARALDTHLVDPAAIRTPTLLIGAPEDRLVPFAQLQELHLQVSGPCRLVRLPSRFGHDAFLHETPRLDTLLRDALAAGALVGGVA